MTYKTESSRYRHLTVPHCYRHDGQPGCGVDIASYGDPVVPWVMQLDLSPSEFDYYNSGNKPFGPVQLFGHGDKLPFADNSLDFVFSSHLLEDYPDWTPVLREWVSVLKPGGKLIVIIPDRELWLAALAAGQPPNDAHRHEGYAGELSTYAAALGMEVIEDRLTECHPGDYSILFVARKL